MFDLPHEALGVHPIAGDLPAGEDARYEPEYATILEEIEKLSFSGQGTPISWPAIEKNAILLLSEKSKDLQIASYLGVALWNNHGFPGLIYGTHVLAGLLENYWENGWPALKRMRGRVNSLDWWYERTFTFVQEMVSNSQAVDAALHKEFMEALGKLDELSGTLLPDASSMHGLLAVTKRLSLIEAQPEPAPPLPAQPEAAQPVSPPPPPAPEPQAQPVTADEKPIQPAPPQPAPKAEPPALPSPAPKAAQEKTPAPEQAQATQPVENKELANLFRQFSAAGHAWLNAARAVEPARAMLWQLSRMIVWSPIAALPPAEEGVTLLPTPDTGILAQARQQLDKGLPLQAVLQAEAFFVTAPFLLDTQHLIHQGLLALGPDFDEAAGAVAQECLAFVARFPAVTALAFNDGTPLASPQTQLWLTDLIGQTGGHAPTGPSSPTLGRALSPSLGMTKRADLPATLTQAMDRLEAAKTPSPVENLRINIQELRLLCEHGLALPAQSLAEALLLEVTGRDLDNWDPSLTVETLVAVRNALSMTPAHYENELRETRRRIARLSPSAALE